MGRGRRGIIKDGKKALKGEVPHWGIVYSEKVSAKLITPTMVEFAQALTKEQLAAALFPAARPSTPHEQTPAWAHRAGSTPRVSPVS